MVPDLCWSSGLTQLPLLVKLLELMVFISHFHLSLIHFYLVVLCIMPTQSFFAAAFLLVCQIFARKKCQHCLFLPSIFAGILANLKIPG